MPPHTFVYLRVLSAAIFSLKKINVYLLFTDKEGQTVSRGGAERAGDTESEADSRL